MRETIVVSVRFLDSAHSKRRIRAGVALVRLSPSRVESGLPFRGEGGIVHQGTPNQLGFGQSSLWIEERMAGDEFVACARRLRRARQWPESAISNRVKWMFSASALLTLLLNAVLLGRMDRRPTGPLCVKSNFAMSSALHFTGLWDGPSAKQHALTVM